MDLKAFEAKVKELEMNMQRAAATYNNMIGMHQGAIQMLELMRAAVPSSAPVVDVVETALKVADDVAKALETDLKPTTQGE